jgi:hypothetical protein
VIPANLQTRRLDQSLTVVPARVWVYDDSAGTYTADTTDAGDTDSADWALFPASEEAVVDASLIGAAHRFLEFTMDNAGGTAGAGGTTILEYRSASHASGWAPCTGVVDGTTGLTIAAADGQVVSFDDPGDDWIAEEIGGSGGALFYVRWRVLTVYSTNPVYDQIFIGTFTGDAGDRGRVYPSDLAGGPRRYHLETAILKVVSGAATSRLALFDAATNAEVLEILPASAEASRAFAGSLRVPDGLDVRWIVTGQTGTVRVIIEGRAL